MKVRGSYEISKLNEVSAWNFCCCSGIMNGGFHKHKPNTWDDIT